MYNIHFLLDVLVLFYIKRPIAVTETSSWPSSRALDRPTPQRHWICSYQPLETGHPTGPWWSDATARPGYAMTTTTTNGSNGSITICVNVYQLYKFIPEIIISKKAVVLSSFDGHVNCSGSSLAVQEISNTNGLGGGRWASLVDRKKNL